MRVLAFDTSAEEGGLTVNIDGVLKNLPIQDTTKIAENIFKYIDTFFQDTGIAINDIDLFSTITGPGSFTGLRVSLSVIKSFSLATSRPVIGVGTFEAMAYYVSKNFRDFSDIVVLGNARRNELFISIYDPGLREVLSIQIIKPEDLSSYISHLVAPFFIFRDREIASYLSPDMQQILIGRDLSIVCAEIALNLFNDGVRHSPEEIEPLYIRNDIVRIRG